MTTDFNKIPIIDFGRFLNGSQEEKSEVAKQIGEACRNVGFFYLKNHGISAKLTEDTLVQVERYFALPLDMKMKDAVTGRSKDDGRGYQPFLAEQFSSGKGDRKESYYFALELDEDDPDVKRGGALYGPNHWPDLPGFREVLYDDYYLAMKDLAQQLLKAFALALNLSENYFDSLTDKPLANMSLMHYPSQSLDGTLEPHSIAGKLKTFVRADVGVQQTQSFGFGLSDLGLGFIWLSYV
ncbi:hypothetical protein I4U23_000043 [Adineta vaga]|nr:hypothetical protein I4U23_000043 [Adineta vaga]